MRPLAYMNRAIRSDPASDVEEPSMRAETEKLAEAIRQSLALLRRHL